MPVVRSNGIEIAYEERGEGEPLVLATGIGMQLVGWPDAFLDRLAARGFRVIVFDHRDVGMSTKLTAAGVPPVQRLIARALLGLPVEAPYTLFDMADDVVGLLDALGLPKAHLAGVSMGGMVAQAAAIRHGARWKSLVSLMSHPGGKLLTISKPYAAMALLGKLPRTREEAIQRQVEFFRTVGSPGFARDDSLVREAAGRAYDRSFNPPGFARHFAAILATGDMRSRLRDVKTPTLVLHGADDPLVRPSHGKDTAKNIPGAKLRIIDGWGHDLAVGVWDLLISAIAEHAKQHTAR